MSDEIDWELTTWEGNRRRQRREFLDLPFRKKLEMIEQMAEVSGALARRRSVRQQRTSGDGAREGSS
ncbi:MAG: hypothetical protein WD766_10285 [Gemmatimonadota bacterium]